MRLDALCAFMRKYWYFIILFGGLIGGIVGLAAYHDFNFQVLLRRYGYGIIVGWTFLEGETIVVIAGMFANKFGLNPWLIALSAFCGSFISDQVMFSLGKYKGTAVLEHFPRVAANLGKAAKLFKRYDIALILGFRFVYGVRNVTPILLGISGVSHRKFFILNGIGAALWALCFAFGGFYAGKAFGHVMQNVGQGIFYVILGLCVIGGIIWFIRARRSVRQAAVGARIDLARIHRARKERKERKAMESKN